MGGKKHVTSACMNCRRRKVKCDGKETCSNCTNLKTECVYNAASDMRKVSAKRVIGQLRSRLAQLEETLREQGMQQYVQSTGNDCQSLLDLYDAKVTNHDDEDVMVIDPALQASSVQYTSTAEIPIPSNQSVSSEPPQISETVGTAPSDGTVEQAASTQQSSVNSPPMVTTGLTPTMPSSHSESHPDGSDCQQGFTSERPILVGGDHTGGVGMSLGSFQAPDHLDTYDDFDDEDTDSEDSIADLLAARAGSLRVAEDGQIRYYGPTSNLHIQSNGYQSLSQSMIRQVATEGNGVLQCLGLDRPVPLDLQTHLAKLYFTWEDPAIHVIDEDVFFEEKEQWLRDNRSTPYYSETLNNAICAVGASLAVGEHFDLPQPASEFFSARAKALLDIEMDSPTIATVQALVIMSASEAASTRDTRGWLYCGMAAKLSADLGLHLDVTKHRNSGLLSQRDLDIRKTAFWGVFIHENMWCLYVGRPWGLSVQDITVSRPNSQVDQPRQKVWKAYPESSPRERLSVPGEGIFFSMDACTNANVELCDFMRKINMTLYSGRRYGMEVLIRFLRETKESMFAWRENIHHSLKVDPLDHGRIHAPAVLQLHMQFYAVLISLYRPYLSTGLMRRVESLGKFEDRKLVQNAVTDCVEAAHQTAEFLRCHQRQHSLIRLNIQVVHLIFTASLVFIFDVCSRTYAESRTSLRNLQFCCHSLGEIGQCYGNATRALEVVILVKSEWQKLVLARQARLAAAKRGSSSVPPVHNDNLFNKRQHRPSFVADTPSRLGGELPGRESSDPVPSSFSAFQMLCDRYIRPSTGPLMGVDTNGLLMEEDALNDQVMSAQMDWLEDDQLAAMVQSINDSNVT